LRDPFGDVAATDQALRDAGQAIKDAGAKCLGEKMKSETIKTTIYLFVAREANGNVRWYVGRTARGFGVRIKEHIRRLKKVGIEPVNHDFLELEVPEWMAGDFEQWAYEALSDWFDDGSGLNKRNPKRAGYTIPCVDPKLGK
jgi:hypothetical protein